MPTEPEFLNPRREVDAHERRLPHWSQGQVAVYVTWRLGDALPVELRARWRGEREEWLKLHPRPWSAEIEEEYHATFPDRFDAWLDAGMGSCALRRHDVRSLVEATLLFRHDLDYSIHDFVIMPNHVHVLFSATGAMSWEQIVSTWKRVSAHRINRLLKRAGPLWQEEVWDRLVRNERHFAACSNYIRENPARAKIRDDEFTVFQRCGA